MSLFLLLNPKQWGSVEPPPLGQIIHGIGGGTTWPDRKRRRKKKEKTLRQQLKEKLHDYPIEKVQEIDLSPFDEAIQYELRRLKAAKLKQLELARRKAEAVRQAAFLKRQEQELVARAFRVLEEEAERLRREEEQELEDILWMIDELDL